MAANPHTACGRYPHTLEGISRTVSRRPSTPTHCGPRDGLDTTNAREFCDPAFDKRVAHAASVQATDPLAAGAGWARLDRELTDRAIRLPIVTPNEIDVVSSAPATTSTTPYGER
jgi:hypothetical protein